MSRLMQEWPRPHRITVEHYYRMAEAGLFAPNERVELIDGAIIDMAPIGSRHAGTVEQLANLLAEALHGRAMVRRQQPVRLGDDSEPQPDVAVVKPRRDFYKARHPRVDDVLLLVEVSDTPKRYDREVKVPLYARHGVVETWVIDLASEQIHFYREPVTGRYTVAQSTSEAGVVPLAAVAGVTVDLAPLWA